MLLARQPATLLQLNCCQLCCNPFPAHAASCCSSATFRCVPCLLLAAPSSHAVSCWRSELGCRHTFWKIQDCLLNVAPVQRTCARETGLVKGWWGICCRGGSGDAVQHQRERWGDEAAACGVMYRRQKDSKGDSMK
jgi:hypothetical protein